MNDKALVKVNVLEMEKDFARLSTINGCQSSVCVHLSLPVLRQAPATADIYLIE